MSLSRDAPGGITSLQRRRPSWSLWVPYMPSGACLCLASSQWSVPIPQASPIHPRVLSRTSHNGWSHGTGTAQLPNPGPLERPQGPSTLQRRPRPQKQLPASALLQPGQPHNVYMPTSQPPPPPLYPPEALPTSLPLPGWPLSLTPRVSEAAPRAAQEGRGLPQPGYQQLPGTSLMEGRGSWLPSHTWAPGAWDYPLFLTGVAPPPQSSPSARRPWAHQTSLSPSSWCVPDPGKPLSSRWSSTFPVGGPALVTLALPHLSLFRPWLWEFYPELPVAGGIGSEATVAGCSPSASVSGNHFPSPPHEGLSHRGIESTSLSNRHLQPCDLKPSICPL